MKKTVKIISYLSTGIILLLLILFLLISSGVLNPVIIKILNTIGSQQLNGTLAIESIEGNLFHEFSLNNIQIAENNCPVIDINSLEIKYDIWELKQKKLKIDRLILNQTHLDLIQTQDSLWNIQKLISINETPDEDSLPFTWKIEIGAIQIKDFEATVKPVDSVLSIPHNIKFNTMLNFFYENNKVLLNLQQFDMKTQNPEFQVQNLNFSAALSDSILKWDEFELKLANSNLSSSGSLPINNPFLAQVNFNASPLDFADFKLWLPDIYGTPEINIRIINTSGISNINFDLIHDKQKVKVNGKIKDFDRRPNYQLLLEADSLNLEYWTHNPEFKSNIKGRLELSGEGFDLKENSMKVQAQFTDIKYKNYNPENLSLSFTKSKENLDAKLKSSTLIGNLTTHIHISGLFEIPTYDAYVNLSHFNLGKLTADKNLESDLNFELMAKGMGYEPGKMHANIQLKTINSVLFGEPIHDMLATINISENKYTIEGLFFESSYLSASIDGYGNFSDDNTLNFYFKSKNLEPVLSIFGLSPFHFDGAINGNISGPLNAMDFDADIDINEFTVDSLALNKTTANLKTSFSLDPNEQHTNYSNDILHLSEITLQNLNINTSGHVGAFSFDSYVLENIDFDTYKKREIVKGNVATLGQFGSVETQFRADHIFTIPQYSFSASLKNIDLAKLTGNDSLYSDLNIEIIAQGKGFNPDSMDIVVEL
ncbi:hypothetical protein ACFLSA_06485, partial [Bacteroidota bacterium]